MTAASLLVFSSNGLLAHRQAQLMLQGWRCARQECPGVIMPGPEGMLGGLRRSNESQSRCTGFSLAATAVTMVRRLVCGLIPTPQKKFRLECTVNFKKYFDT
jgi:hypothetical protein